jgi:hypothetical protein
MGLPLTGRASCNAPPLATGPLILRNASKHLKVGSFARTRSLGDYVKSSRCLQIRLDIKIGAFMAPWLSIS